MTLITVGAILAAALAVPGPALAGQPAESRGTDQTIEQVEREIERVAETVQREVARALEGHEQDVEAIVREVERLAENLAADVARSLEHTLESLEQSQEERAREQAERERQRAAEQAERAQEQAARIRERALEQAERERERAREQAERAKQRAAEQAERNRERAEQQGRSVETERTTRTIKIGPNGDLDVSNMSGDIVLSRASANELTVEIIKTARAETAEAAKALLPLTHVDVIERGNRVEIRTRYEPNETMRRSRRHVSVGLNIAAPAGTRVSVRSMSGSITSKGIQGELSLESMSGSIRVADGGRVTGAKTMSGDVEITGTQTDGIIEASSASGSVTVKGVKARALDVGSISGSVLLDDVSARRVEAQTVSGNLRLTGTLVEGGRYELSSHSGDVEVGVGGGAGFEVEATSFSGPIQTDFPIKADENRGFGPRTRSLQGVVGNGSAVLELSTFSGNISIRKR